MRGDGGGGRGVRVMRRGVWAGRGEGGGGGGRVQGRRRFVSKQQPNTVCQVQYNDVGESSESRGGAHMGVSERIDTILNGTQLN